MGSTITAAIFFAPAALTSFSRCQPTRAMLGQAPTGKALRSRSSVMRQVIDAGNLHGQRPCGY